MPPQNEDEKDEGGGEPGHPLVLVQRRGDRASNGLCVARRTGENGSDDGDEPVENGRLPDLTQDRAADQEDVARGWAIHRRGERIDGVITSDASEDQHEQADDHKRPADVAECLAPDAAGEIDRDSEHDQHEHEQPDAQHPRRTDACLNVRKLIGLHHCDHACVRRNPCEHTRRQPELRSELLEQLAEVESDIAVSGRGSGDGLVLDDVHELLVRRRAGSDEQLLSPRPSEQQLHRVGCRLPQCAGERASQALQTRGQSLPERPGDVNVFV